MLGFQYNPFAYAVAGSDPGFGDPLYGPGQRCESGIIHITDEHFNPTIINALARLVADIAVRCGYPATNLSRVVIAGTGAADAAPFTTLIRSNDDYFSQGLWQYDQGPSECLLDIDPNIQDPNDPMYVNIAALAGMTAEGTGEPVDADAFAMFIQMNGNRLPWLFAPNVAYDFTAHRTGRHNVGTINGLATPMFTHDPTIISYRNLNSNVQLAEGLLPSFEPLMKATRHIQTSWPEFNPTVSSLAGQTLCRLHNEDLRYVDFNERIPVMIAQAILGIKTFPWIDVTNGGNITVRYMNADPEISLYDRIFNTVNEPSDRTFGRGCFNRPMPHIFFDLFVPGFDVAGDPPPNPEEEEDPSGEDPVEGEDLAETGNVEGDLPPEGGNFIIHPSNIVLPCMAPALKLEVQDVPSDDTGLDGLIVKKEYHMVSDAQMNFGQLTGLPVKLGSEFDGFFNVKSRMFGYPTDMDDIDNLLTVDNGYMPLAAHKSFLTEGGFYFILPVWLDAGAVMSLHETGNDTNFSIPTGRHDRIFVKNGRGNVSGFMKSDWAMEDHLDPSENATKLAGAAVIHTRYVNEFISVMYQINDLPDGAGAEFPTHVKSTSSGLTMEQSGYTWFFDGDLIKSDQLISFQGGPSSGMGWFATRGAMPFTLSTQNQLGSIELLASAPVLGFNPGRVVDELVPWGDPSQPGAPVLDGSIAAGWCIHVDTSPLFKVMIDVTRNES